MGLCLSYLFISFHFSTQRCCPHSHTILLLLTFVLEFDLVMEQSKRYLSSLDHIMLLFECTGRMVFFSTFLGEMRRRWDGGRDTYTQRENTERRNVEKKRIRRKKWNLLSSFFTSSPPSHSVVVSVVDSCSIVVSFLSLSLICNQPAGNKSSNWILCVFVYEACKCSISWMGPQCSFFSRFKEVEEDRGRRCKRMKKNDRE